MLHRFTWFGDIDDRFLYKLHQRLPRPDLIPDDETPRYQLVLSSPGGSIYHALSATEYFDALPNGVDIHVTCECMSAALLVVACGTPGLRSATPMTRFMCHGGRVDMSESVTSAGLRIEGNELLHLEDRYIWLLGERTRKSAKWWSERVRGKRDAWYFSAKLAKDYGLIDEVTPWP